MPTADPALVPNPELESEDEDGDVCRICRMPAEDDNPLFFPCKCSGSIKYVHQQCLVDWLTHSGNTHCEVCGWVFRFAPIYAKDAPSTLPWHELIYGLLRRAAGAVQTAHRIWLVCSVWLILVPLGTGLAWRVAFASSCAEIPMILSQRLNILAIATDCLQGSVLSIAIVFLNMGLGAMREYLRQCIANVEAQMLRAEPPPEPHVRAPQLPLLALPAPAVRDGVEDAAAAAAAGAGGAAARAAVAGEDADAAGGAAPPGAAGGNGDVGGVARPPARAWLPPLPQLLGPEQVEELDALGDMPFEELVGLQGSWAAFMETVLLVLVGNAFFMFVVVYIPLNLGRAALVLCQRALALLAANPGYELSVAQFLRRSLHPSVFDLMLADTALARITAVAVEAMANATAAAGTAAGGAAAMVANATAAAATASAAAVMAPPLGDFDPLSEFHLNLSPIMTMVTMEQLLRELSEQMSPPTRADLLALTLGHGALLLGGVAVLWGYVLLRLWKLHLRRSRWVHRLSLWTTLCTAGTWAVTVMAQVMRVMKLVLVLLMELGLMPLLCGVWLDVCALPVVGATIEDRIKVVIKVPMVAAFTHWVMGLGVMLGTTLVMSVLRETLRPGALPFLRDPMHGDRNALRDMMEEPLFGYAMRAMVYAALCALLVHVPALLARTLVPNLFPLNVLIFDPLTQFPTDMLLFHIFIPFTVEHMRVRAALRITVRIFLTCAGWLLGWQQYLLAPDAPAADEAPAGRPRPPAEEAAVMVVGWDRADNGAAQRGVPAAAAAGQAHGPLAPAPGAPEAPAPHLAQLEAPAMGPAPAQAAAVAQTTDTAAVEENAAAGPSSSAPSSSSAAAPGAGSPAGQAPAHTAAAPVVASGSSSHNGVTVTLDMEFTLSEEMAAVAATYPEHVVRSALQHAAEQAVSAAAAAAATAAGEELRTRHAPPSLAAFEAHRSYPYKLAALLALWLASLVVLNTAALLLPVSLGRMVLGMANLPMPNDLYTFIAGAVAIWLAASAVRAARRVVTSRNLRAAVAGAAHWLLLFVKCMTLVLLWLGVAATLLGMLVELTLMPLRLPRNQSALMYLYQDWTMGVLGLKLWHLMLMVTPRREGQAAAPDTWQAHFELLQRDGLRGLQFRRALTRIVLPMLMNLATALAAPYVITRGILPASGLPVEVLTFVSLYAYTGLAASLAALYAVKVARRAVVKLHNAIRDDRYLVGRELRNFAGDAPPPQPLVAEGGVAEGAAAFVPGDGAGEGRGEGQEAPAQALAAPVEVA